MKNKGQNISEYGLILAVVVVAFTAMNIYFKRGIQGIVKSSADQLGAKAEADYFNIAQENLSHQVLGASEPGMVAFSSDTPDKITENSVLQDSESHGARHRISVTNMVIQGANSAVYAQGGSDSFSAYQQQRLPNPPSNPTLPGSTGTGQPNNPAQSASGTSGKTP